MWGCGGVRMRKVYMQIERSKFLSTIIHNVLEGATETKLAPIRLRNMLKTQAH